MKEKRIGILTLCCLLAVVLSFAAVPCRAADTSKTYTVHHTATYNAVNGGHFMSASMDIQYQAGATVTLTPFKEDNFYFQEWEIPNGLTLTKGDNKTTEISFIMPEWDITVNEIKESFVPAYSIIVTNNVKKNTSVSHRELVGFEAQIYPDTLNGYHFYEWQNLDGLTITNGDKYTEKVSIIMPEHDVRVNALFTCFDDVLPSMYYFDPVLWAVDKGITNGTTDTTFAPGNTCTTANIITFLWRANGSPAPSKANPFSDVPAGAYYEKAAIWACEKDMVSGGTFNGNSPCTRAATMKYLWILAGRPASGNAPFTDVSPNADYAQAVAWAVEQGVTKGKTDTTFAPDDTCTRGQIVTFLYRHYAQ